MRNRAMSLARMRAAAETTSFALTVLRSARRLVLLPLMLLAVAGVRQPLLSVRHDRIGREGLFVNKRRYNSMFLE
jgi:hypothetical protein